MIEQHSTPAAAVHAEAGPIAKALAGLAALAVAMGIGRFAFTPVLPMMLQDAGLSIASGGLLASANYVGYLLGALSAMVVKIRPEHAIRGGLLAIAAVTLAMGWPMPFAAWLALRLLAGVASAWVLISVSAWCMESLARYQRPFLNSLVFAGVGTGIATAGLMCLALIGFEARSPQAWMSMGLLSLAVTLVIWRFFRTTSAAAAAKAEQGRFQWNADALRLVFCYGVFGFGYIGPATFLPAMARALIDDPARFGLVWPLFGAAAVASTLGSLRLLARLRPLQAWVLCQSTLALGTAMPLLSRSPAALVVAALAVGSTFVLVTVIAMAVARERVPRQPAPLVARMTAAFALGQIAGPLLVRALDGVHLPGLAGWGPIELSSALASAAVLASVVWLWRLSAASPAPRG